MGVAVAILPLVEPDSPALLPVTISDRSILCLLRLMLSVISFCFSPLLFFPDDEGGLPCAGPLETPAPSESLLTAPVWRCDIPDTAPTLLLVTFILLTAVEGGNLALLAGVIESATVA